MSHPTAPGSARQHHLDALRAFAMLLGIGLHAALSFTDALWIPKDHVKSETLKWFFEAVHGFRMHLFFLVSGYFTMMLWRKRGLPSLLEQRFHRVLVPCLLALVTIVPLMQIVTVWAMETVPQKKAAEPAPTRVAPEKSPLVEAIRGRDFDEVERQLATGADANQPDREFGIPPLGWAALHGDSRIAKLLLDRGADVNAKDRDGYRPLHQSAFLGSEDVTKLLLQRGADRAARSKNKDTALDSAAADWFTTRMLADDLGVLLKPREEIDAGRAACLRLLEGETPVESAPESLLESIEATVKPWQTRYLELIASPHWNLNLNRQGPPCHLILTGQFWHLWFLWFLCWMVLIFAVVARFAEWVPVPRLPRFLVLSRLRLLWLVPLTMVPQLFMGVLFPTFGPDTCMGVVPMPHLLVFYGLFFAVGALYYDCNDTEGKLGRLWWLWLPVASGCMILAKEYQAEPLVTGFFQVLFAWSSIFGLMGLFRAVLNREYRGVRYLSDSAYWLYLAHLPLVIYLQGVVRDWDYPALVKFFGLCVVSSAALLLSYQLLVRHTYLGTILNGPRKVKQTGSPGTSGSGRS